MWKPWWTWSGLFLASLNRSVTNRGKSPQRKCQRQPAFERLEKHKVLASTLVTIHPLSVPAGETGYAIVAIDQQISTPLTVSYVATAGGTGVPAVQGPDSR